jgi:hypothetical protein
VSLRFTAWSTDTARASAIAIDATNSDGKYVNTSNEPYLGSFYTTATTTTEDSLVKRYLWNMYNPKWKPMRAVDTTNSWSWSTASYHQANANANNQLNFFRGFDFDAIHAEVVHSALNSTGTGRNVYAAIGLDSTTTASGLRHWATISNALLGHFHPVYDDYPGIGKHFLAWLECGAGADTQTWYGDNGGSLMQTGISGGGFF